MKERQILLFKVIETLETMGYICSDSCFLGNTCLDFLARKDGKLLIIKVISNIDSITESQAAEMLKLASLFGASPVIIGKKRRLGSLEDNVVYNRKGIYTLSLTTFSRALDGELPSAESDRGGYFVNLDHEALTGMRKELRLSRKKVAESAGITPRMLYDYERDKSKASMKVAVKLEKIFSTKISIGIDIFSIPEIPEDTNSSKNSLLNRLALLGFDVFPAKKAPFSGVIKEKKEIIITRKFTLPVKLIKNKIALLKSIAETAETGAFIVSREKHKTIFGLPNIKEKEIKEMKEASELFEIIEEHTAD